MRIFYKLRLIYQKSKKRYFKSKLFEVLDLYESQETFHYIVNMNPTTYERKKREFLRLISLYESKLSKCKSKINYLKGKLA